MCSEYHARVINRWISVNVLFVFWCILTGAVGLQQFDCSEPLAAGFFWGSIGAFVLGSLVNHELGIANPTGLAWNIAIQVGAIAVQIWLATAYWNELKAIDAALKEVRTGAVMSIPYADHRLIGRAVWLFFTLLGIRRALKRGFLFFKVGVRP